MWAATGRQLYAVGLHNKWVSIMLAPGLVTTLPSCWFIGPVGTLLVWHVGCGLATLLAHLALALRVR